MDLVTRLLLNSSQFDNNIRNSTKEVQQFQEMGKNVTLAIGKFAGALGLAMGANEAFNRTINSTQTTGDAWVKMNEQMKSSVDSFFTSLAMGDFSGFLNNLQNVINKAGNLADIMDELATKSLFTNSELSSLNMQKNVQMNIARDRSKSDADRNKALQEAEKIQQRINALQKSEAGTSRKAANTTVRSALAKQGFKGELTDNSISWLLKESNRSKVGAGASDYKNRVKAIDSAKNVDSESGIQTHSKESRKLQAEFDKYMQTQRGKQNQLFYYFSEMDDGEKSMLASAIQLNNRANDMYSSISTAELEQNMVGAKIDGSWKSKNKASGSKKGDKKADEIINKGSLDEISKQLAEARKKYNSAATDELRLELFQVVKDLEAKQIHLNFIAEYGDMKKTDLKQAGLGDALKSTQLPKKIEPIKTGVTKKSITLNNDYVDSLNAIGSTLGAITNMTNEGASAWLNWGATLLSAIASSIPAIAALTTAKTAEANANSAAAVTGGVSSAASTPLIGWLLAGAAAASVIAALSNIPKFANGGLVYGNSIVNVGEYAGASSNPEVIAPLNKLKQLMKPEGSSVMAGEVSFRIAGKELVGVLTNYSSKLNKIK